jgi:hypothetical protein
MEKATFSSETRNDAHHVEETGETNCHSQTSTSQGHFLPQNSTGHDGSLTVDWVQMTQNTKESMFCRPSLSTFISLLYMFAAGVLEWGAIVIVSAFMFISPVSSSMIAPASKQLAEHFDIHSTVLLAMTVSVFVLGYGGCLSFSRTVHSVQNLFIAFFPSYHSIWSVIPWPTQ